MDQTQVASKSNIPTEQIELPSRGLVYSKENPLSSGVIEMKYMTAKEEDILTNRNFIANGTVIDKLLQSLIVSKINYNDLVVGDKNAILVAARILGYGADYTFSYNGEEITVDLSGLEEKKFDESHLMAPNTNEFKFKLPHTNNEVTFKLLTHKDEQDIDRELEALRKLTPQGSFENTTRLKYMITSVNGDRDRNVIKDFIDNQFIARDSRAFKKHVGEVMPDVKLEFTYEGNGRVEEGVSIPVGVNFFWPDA